MFVLAVQLESIYAPTQSRKRPCKRTKLVVTVPSPAWEIEILSAGEDSGLFVIRFHPIIDVMANGRGEYAPLYVAPPAHQIVRRVAMRDAFDISLDDRSLV